MSPGNAVKYMTKYATRDKSGNFKYKTPPGFSFFMEEMIPCDTSINNKCLFLQRRVQKAPGVNRRVFNEVVASLPPANILIKNGNVDQSMLLKKISNKKSELHFTPNAVHIPFNTARMAFNTGKNIGKGRYGQTRLHTLSDGTRVIIKSFFGEKCIQHAKKEQEAHMRAWEVEELRKYITKPMVTEIMNNGNKAFTVQFFAGNPGEIVNTLIDLINAVRKGSGIFTDVNIAFKKILSDIKKFIQIMQQNNIRHNDLNANNILVRSKDGNYLGIVVIDWGLSLMSLSESKKLRYALEEYWTKNISNVDQQKINQHPKLIIKLRKRLGNNIRQNGG